MWNVIYSNFFRFLLCILDSSKIIFTAKVLYKSRGF